MELAGLFANVDNLYKFLFIGSFLMVFFSVTYPINRRNELEIKIIEHNYEAEVLNRRISELKSDIIKLNDIAQTLNDSLNNGIYKNALPTNRIDDLKGHVNSQYDTVKKMYSELNKSVLLNKYNKKKIKSRRLQMMEYEKYARYFMFFGILTGCISLFFWIKSTNQSEKLKALNLKEKEHAISALNHPSPSLPVFRNRFDAIIKSCMIRVKKLFS